MCSSDLDPTGRCGALPPGPRDPRSIGSSAALGSHGPCPLSATSTAQAQNTGVRAQRSSHPGNPWRTQKVNSEPRLTFDVARTCFHGRLFLRFTNLTCHTPFPPKRKKQSPHMPKTPFISISTCLSTGTRVNGVSVRFYQQRAARRVDTLFRTSGMGGGHRPGHLQLGV